MKYLKWLLIMAVVLLLIKLASIYMLPHGQGLAMLDWNGVRYQSTAVDAGLMLAGALLLLWFVWSIVTSPVRALRERRNTTNRLRLAEGIDAYQQGDWSRAEKTLQKAAESNPEVVGISRVAATRSALARGDHKAAQIHIDALTSVDDGKHTTRTALLQAELAMDKGYYEQALAALDVPTAQPLPPAGLALRAKALAAMGRASEAYGLLGSLRQSQAISTNDLAKLQLEWSASAISQAVDSNALASVWDETPKDLKLATPIVANYASKALSLGWDAAAAKSLENAIETNWDPQLLHLYATQPTQRSGERRARVERWLAQRPNNPDLLTALAHLSQQ